MRITTVKIIGVRRSSMVGLIIITLAALIFTESAAIKSVATPALQPMPASQKPYYVLSKPPLDNFSSPTEARDLMYQTQTKLTDEYKLDPIRVKVKADTEADYEKLCRGVTPCDGVEVLKLADGRNYTVRIMCGEKGEQNISVPQPITRLVAKYLANEISNHDKNRHK
jgi:hypothetical protein